ncbi:MAG: TIGR02466 family protein [Xanthomonadaceae bacterium]|nr:TIGR02466 family protein [Xanthomonadaceae bacterium]MDP2186726.1 TIGR02466 family protein [Xanthomonadales bacterium]MDZ4117546.1 TIGR02466 family protein [Xanthomonadaceae bacterium]MDZ4377885.1 TIGR02466 family protein [Xanthomonadaceae bacterium]
MTPISTLFAVPCVSVIHPDPHELNRQLRELFIAREGEGRRYANPNPLVLRNNALFESNFDLFSWPEPCVQELKSYCWQHLQSIIAQLNRYDAITMARLRIHADCWFHVTRNGGYFTTHNHPMASWSGVYCVASGADASEPADSGILSFPNPNTAASMFNDAGNSAMAPPYSFGAMNFKLKPGQLVLFPSWVLHEVKPYLGPRERITVAFNTWFSLAES